ncbi:MAG: STAS domain-containing protein [Rhodospirillales bacterium]|nr:STAS domain-containing protein [Rhodospirillales bacterium]
MDSPPASRLPSILDAHADDILSEWIARLRSGGADDRISEVERERQASGFLQRMIEAIRASGVADIEGPAFEPLREMLSDISRSRAMQGFSPTESALFVFSLKQPLFHRLGLAWGKDAEGLARDVWAVTLLIDALGLRMMEAWQKTREEVIIRQQQEIAELSTPVVKLWQGILALPLIGTLDSSRTQVVMENLLESIVQHEADIAIIDITGVPTVDTLVAQHLLKTVAAARLMGADCIISGIRPQIAQTMVHLGVELNVISKANLSDAFALALRRIGRAVVRTKSPVPVMGTAHGE